MLTLARARPSRATGVDTAATHSRAARAASQRWRPRDPVPVVQRRCSCGGAGAASDEECEECRARRVQRRAAGETGRSASGYAAEPASPHFPAIVGRVLSSPGRPLDGVARAWFERRFERDFSDVRIHTDEAAAQSAHALDAQAFTSGRHIVFGTGQYDARSERGTRLLAHELTHVVQQRRGLALRGVSASTDPAEREAERNAELLKTAVRPTFSASPHTVSRQPEGASETTVTVTEPTGPGACRLSQHRVIEPAVRLAQQWLRTGVAALDAYIGAPAAAAQARVRDALTRHFRTADAAIAGRLRTRFETIRTDLTGRDPFISECHTDADRSCTNSGAYVPGSNQSMVVFCPAFFTSSSNDWRAGALIHEMAHALLGLRISDRAYESDRLLPLVSTAEALDNAESHAQLAQELGTGRVVRGTPPSDEVEECAPEVGTLVREALARAQRWNRDAETVANDARAEMVADNAPLFTTHLGDALPATRAAARRVFSNMVVRLRSPVNVVCDAEAAPECSSRRAYKKAGVSNIGRGVGIGLGIGGAVGLVAGLATGFAFGAGIGVAVGLGALALGALIGLIAGAATSTSDAVHVCPAWRSQANPADRTESLLAALYETYAGVSVRQSRRYAALARALHDRYIGAPPPI